MVSGATDKRIIMIISKHASPLAPTDRTVLCSTLARVAFLIPLSRIQVRMVFSSIVSMRSDKEEVEGG
jgi:hypothetical protein